MKAKIALLFFFLSGLIRAQQDNFIIGADWLNSFRQDRVDNAMPMSDAYWALIKSFNLNFGTIAYKGTNSGNIFNIKQVLDKANSNGIKLELNPVTYPDIEHAMGNLSYGVPKRWMFQIEGTLDFATHGYFVGEDTHVDQDPVKTEPEEHWSLAKSGNPIVRIVGN